MSRSRGFVLPAVLAVLVLMALSVAVGAQRALLAARQATMDGARADLAMATAGARAAALAAGPDSACCRTMLPGALLDSGTSRVGRARASWRVLGAAAPYALVELEAEGSTTPGATRASYRLLVTRIPDSTGWGHWTPATAVGWTRLPSR